MSFTHLKRSCFISPSHNKADLDEVGMIGLSPAGIQSPFMTTFENLFSFLKQFCEVNFDRDDLLQVGLEVS